MLQYWCSTSTGIFLKTITSFLGLRRWFMEDIHSFTPADVGHHLASFSPPFSRCCSPSVGPSPPSGTGQGDGGVRVRRLHWYQSPFITPSSALWSRSQTAQESYSPIWQWGGGMAQTKQCVWPISSCTKSSVMLAAPAAHHAGQREELLRAVVTRSSGGASPDETHLKIIICSLEMISCAFQNLELNPRHLRI